MEYSDKGYPGNTCAKERGESSGIRYSRDEQVQMRAERICRSIQPERARGSYAGRTAAGDGEARGSYAGRTAVGDGEARRQRREQEERHERRQKRQCMVLAVLALVLVGALALRAFLARNVAATSGQASPLGELLLVGDLKLARQDPLILVNKEHALPEDYKVELHWLKNGRNAVSELMYESLHRMLTDGSTDGRQFVVASGYRDTEKQQRLLDEDIAADMEQEGMTWQEAYDKETRETMPPGHSEHETGLAVDLVSLDYQVLDEAQEQTRENQWLRENCSKYGFILRYPRGKEEITGVDYESWHFRYVGEEAAQEITERGITLEEYLGEQ